MSYFYLKPAKGDMPMHLLEEIVLKRLEYLLQLSKGESPLYNQYVIEGTAHDNVGHFVMCIITALLKSTDFTQFFLNTEVMLFKQRITSLPAYDLRGFAKKLLQILRKIDTTLTFTEPLQILCRHLSLKNIASHICSPSHSDDCILYSMKIYFKHCLSFIAERKVEVSKGIACIHCGKWRQYLVVLFKKGLLLRIAQSKQYLHDNDPRIAQILIMVKKNLPFLRYVDMKQLMSKDVDKSSHYFPPCMLNLHQNLRTKHRLSHDQRFYYSLFLKDIGMPVEEAIEFWRSEYCQTPNGSHKCSHTWEKDQKKFVYGIRHLYGLEGGRKNYISKKCLQIQSMGNSCHEGGCPFKSFDKPNMLQTLKLYDSELILSQIFSLQRKEMYTSACLLYLKKQLKTDLSCDSPNVNFSPVKYFTLAYDMLS